MFQQAGNGNIFLSAILLFIIRKKRFKDKTISQILIQHSVRILMYRLKDAVEEIDVDSCETILQEWENKLSFL